jgi:hypothetical protein
MQLSLVKEGGRWRVYALHKPAAGIDGDTSPPQSDKGEDI